MIKDRIGLLKAAKYFCRKGHNWGHAKLLVRIDSDIYINNIAS